jgi:hypothetical protein
LRDAGTHLLLGELEGALVLPDLEQLRDALLIGGQTGHLTHQRADELGPLGEELGARERRGEGRDQEGRGERDEYGCVRVAKESPFRGVQTWHAGLFHVLHTLRLNELKLMPRAGLGERGARGPFRNPFLPVPRPRRGR